MNTLRDSEKDTSSWVEFPVMMVEQNQLNHKILPKSKNSNHNFIPVFDVYKAPINSKEKVIEDMKLRFSLGEDVSEEIINFLQASNLFDCSNNWLNEPKLTLLGIKPIKPGLAHNLAFHGNPSFDLQDQPRLLGKSKSRELRSKKDPAWFDELFTVL